MRMEDSFVLEIFQSFLPFQTNIKKVIDVNTAKTVNRKFETNIPRHETARP
jgi:hypothetical protein